jgi:hypothetical protein
MYLEYKIINYIDDPDIRRKFGIPPRRILNSRKENLERLLKFPRRGLVWDVATQTLYNFTIPEYYIVMKPVSLDINLDDLCIFNLYEKPYEKTIYWKNGSFLVNTKHSSWATEYPVILSSSSQE